MILGGAAWSWVGTTLVESADIWRIVECCAAAGISSITVSPGVDQPGMSHADSILRSGEALYGLIEIGAASNVPVLFEPHVQSVFESPIDTLEFLRRNPGIEITLDYSHLRQGAKGQMQARWEEGVMTIRA